MRGVRVRERMRVRGWMVVREWVGVRGVRVRGWVHDGGVSE